MGWRLYLDDDADTVRPPERTVENPAWRSEARLPPNPPDLSHLGEWVIARSVDEAREAVSRLGFPSFIAFDHDLSDGRDAVALVDLLIAMDMEEGSMPPDFSYEVHSKNPWGAPNIHSKFESYRRSKGIDAPSIEPYR